MRNTTELFVIWLIRLKDQFEEGTTLDDYVQYLISMGEFNHKMDQPFLEFLNGLTDLLILPAIYESIVGEEIITGEDLNEFERGMKMVGVIVAPYP